MVYGATNWQIIARANAVYLSLVAQAMKFFEFFYQPTGVSFKNMPWFIMWLTTKENVCLIPQWVLCDWPVILNQWNIGQIEATKLNIETKIVEPTYVQLSWFFFRYHIDRAWGLVNSHMLFSYHFHRVHRWVWKKYVFTNLLIFWMKIFRPGHKRQQRIDS